VRFLPRLTLPKSIKSWPKRKLNSRWHRQRFTWRRNLDLFNRRVIAVQDYDTATDTYRENQAIVLADQANINQLESLEAFKIVRAPFAGIVTARNTDIGDYIAAGSGTQLFRMQQTAPLRLYVNVPQAFADLIKIGTEGELTLDEFPSRKFLGHVTNTASAIDPTSRALLTELQLPTETGELFPGAYALVTLRINDNTGILTIPANALLFRSEGTTVGVVDADGKVEIRNITINLNLGDKLEIGSFAQRRPEIASRLRVFEIDQPGPQAWKRQRLIELGFGVPDWLRFVPVDFEAGGAWQGGS
jgi:RND family efflux transporter MFP subunit